MSEFVCAHGIRLLQILSFAVLSIFLHVLLLVNLILLQKDTGQKIGPNVFKVDIQEISTEDKGEKINDISQDISSAFNFTDSNSDKTVKSVIGIESIRETKAQEILIPVLRASELFANGIAYSSFKPEELLHSISFNPSYVNAERVDKRAKALNNLTPVFPELAYQQNKQGRVIMELSISANGKIDRCVVIAATSGFANSASDALCGIEFLPAELGGEKVASRMLVEINYLLVNPAVGISGEENVIPIGKSEKNH